MGGMPLAKVQAMTAHDRPTAMEQQIHVHIDGPVHYLEADGSRFLVPLGPCGAELRPDDGLVRLHWRRAASNDSAAFTVSEFEAYRRDGHIQLTRA